MKNRIFFLLIVVCAILNAQEKKEGLNNEDYAKMAFAIRAKIFELKDEVNKDTSGHLYLSPHDLFSPEKGQTKQGVFLICEYGVPRSVDLPFGRWQFVHQMSVQKKYDQKLMEHVITYFNAKPYEQRSPRGAFIQPVIIYELNQIEGQPLEKPEYKLQTEYMDERHAMALWKALKPQPEGTP